MRDHHHRWQWRVEGVPASLWPWVADTDRFDRDTGVPPVERLETSAAQLADGHVRARVRRLGIALDYEQLPFEWEAPHSFAVTRRFERGPLAELRIEVALTADGDDHTLIDYHVRSTPTGLLGAAAIPVQIGVLLARSFERAMRGYAAVAALGDPLAATAAPRPLGEPARRRLDAALLELRSVVEREELLDALRSLVTDADDLAIARLRPYLLARQWDEDPGAVLDLFLEATRVGIVRFRWDILCPRCRVASASVEHLALVDADVHCDSCRIDYRADLAASVELTFRPTDQIRPVEVVEHCIGGPMASPHVVVQALVPAAGTASLRAPLATGYYHLRVGGEHRLDLQVGGEGATDGEPVVVHVGGVAGAAPAVVVVPTGARLVLASGPGGSSLVQVERPPTRVDAVTGTAVLARQRFRDLFAHEALRPGEQLDVGTVTIAFTDLCGSTALYRSIGDAVAFGRVQAHFDVLRACVAAHDGAVVKTIGDAVMAVFPNPAAAVAAMCDAQRGMRDLEGPGGPLHLKAGVHVGPAIAVTLNDRIDYFGTSVNLAARLQGLAAADELVLSAAVVDEEVAAMVGAVRGHPDEVVADLRGLEGSEVAIHRVRP